MTETATELKENYNKLDKIFKAEIRRDFMTVCEVPEEYCKDGSCYIKEYKGAFIAIADGLPPIIWDAQAQKWEVVNIFHDPRLDSVKNEF